MAKSMPILRKHASTRTCTREHTRMHYHNTTTTVHWRELNNKNPTVHLKILNLIEKKNIMLLKVHVYMFV